MIDIPKLLEGLAAILWPAIIILLIILFRSELSDFIESARSRKLSFKIGGQELTIEEANKQQQTLIADLQVQVLEIKKRIEAVALPEPPDAISYTMLAPPRSVLWVDDHPKNNSYFVQQLNDKDVNVELALSTSEGLHLFGKKTYGVIISDMGRTEDGKYKPTAGLELLRQIREINKIVPFIIFCTFRGVGEFKQEAMNLGATAITSSPTVMFGILQKTIEGIQELST